MIPVPYPDSIIGILFLALIVTLIVLRFWGK